MFVSRSPTQHAPLPGVQPAEAYPSSLHARLEARVALLHQIGPQHECICTLMQALLQQPGTAGSQMSGGSFGGNNAAFFGAALASSPSAAGVSGLSGMGLSSAGGFGSQVGLGLAVSGPPLSSALLLAVVVGVAANISSHQPQRLGC